MAHASNRKSISAGWAIPALMLLALMAPDIALAGAGFGPINCADKSVSTFLVPLFDSLFSQCGGSKGAFESAIGILNAGALLIGGMLAAYTLVAGTMQTAHDGEMLGKKWSSMWLPIRTVLGVGLAVPINGGFCVAQLLMAFLIGQGVNLADDVWSTYLGTFATPAGMAPKAMLPNVADLARGMLTTQVCMESYNALRSSSGGDNSAIMDTAMAASSPTTGARNYGINGGSECGSVFYEQTPLSLTGANPESGFTETNFDATPLTAVQTAHMAAMAKMEQDLNAVAKLVVSTYLKGGQPPDVGVALNNAVIAYQASVTSSADAVFGNAASLSTFVTAAKTDGWYVAGTYFMKMTQMQDAVNQVVSHTPTAVVPSKETMMAFSHDLAVFFNRLEALLRDSSQNQTIKPSTANAVDEIGNSSGPFQKAVQKVMNSIFGGDWIKEIAPANSNRSALMEVKDFGDHLMTGAEAGMGIGAGISILNSTIGNWIMLISATFLFLAASIAVYLPIAPFLIFFGAFVGWLVLCAEAIIAAPLWAIMHLSPSGDDLMGSAKAGYMMILGVLLRPALIIMGFIFALIASEKIIGAFDQIFFPAFKMAMAGSVMGLGTSIVMIGIYFGALVKLFHTTFGLIHVIPDKLMRWIGGGHEQLGETARGMSQGGKSGHNTTIASIRTIQQQGGLGGPKGKGGSSKGKGDAGGGQEWDAMLDGPVAEMSEKAGKGAAAGAKDLAVAEKAGGKANAEDMKSGIVGQGAEGAAAEKSGAAADAKGADKSAGADDAAGVDASDAPQGKTEAQTASQPVGGGAAQGTSAEPSAQASSNTQSEQGNASSSAEISKASTQDVPAAAQQPNAPSEHAGVSEKTHKDDAKPTA